MAMAKAMRRAVVLAILVLGMMLSRVPETSALLSWSRETVDDPSDTAVGYFNAVALDSGGRPHIAYFDFHNGALKYAKKTSSGAWKIERIDAPPDVSLSVGMGVSIVLDSSNRPHVSYYASVDAAGGDLRYAKRICLFPGDVLCLWVKETVDVGVFSVAGSTSIALDGAGTPHISYFDYRRGQLKWARREGAAWGVATVAGAPAGVTSLAVDSNGLPHIAYTDDGVYPPVVNYARVTCVFIICGWEIESLDVGVLGNLTLDSAGAAHVTYRGAAYAVKYASRSCTSPPACSWNTQTIGSTAGADSRPRLALTSNGAPRIVFVNGYQYGTNVLVHVWKQRAIWFTEAIDSSVTANADVSLVLDSNNRPHVSYQQFPQFSLRYAKGSPLVTQPPLTSSGGSASVH
jgi:hypothetical protein